MKRRKSVDASTASFSFDAETGALAEIAPEPAFEPEIFGPDSFGGEDYPSGPSSETMAAIDDVLSRPRKETATGGGKPPYRVPLMTEVRALPWNGLTVVSTFSGCGGSCLGFKMAGYRVLWASEFVPAAQDTYRANHAWTHLDTSDIRKVTAKTIRAVIGDVEIDVLEGSPPCASFSTAGKTSKGWGQVRKYSDVEQRTDDLFAQYVRLVGELKPRAFVAENVAGMVKGVSKGHFKEYLEQFRGLPYNVEARVIDAQNFDVPQRRRRLIFVGVRKDVGKPRWPTERTYTYSVRDAIPWIVRQGDNGGFGAGGMQDATEPSPTIGASDQTGNGRFPASLVEATLVGGNGAVGSAKGAALSLDEPLPTVLSGGHGPHGMRDRTDQFLISAPRVVYDEGFKDTPPRDVTDQPAPTIKVGINTKDTVATHFVVEGAGSGDQDTRINPDRLASLSARVMKGDVVPDHVGQSIEGYAVEKEWDKLGPGESSDKFFNLVKTDAETPCDTVTASGGQGGNVASVTHPTERRKFSIAELRRICGFPDDFVLTGSYSQQWERLGRAVPPPMMRAVAEALLPVLKKDKP